MEVAARVRRAAAARRADWGGEAAMRLTWRDGVATALVAAAVVLYGLWLSGVAMADVSTRLVALVVFGLGMAACIANQREMAEVFGATREGPRPPMTYVVLATAAGVVILAAGIAAMVTATELMLAVLVAAMVVLWLAATSRHALGGWRASIRPRPGH
jgi:formate/nitrite transporter FocA (FNT family)